MIQFTTPNLDEAIATLDLDEYGFDESPGRTIEDIFVAVVDAGGVTRPEGYDILIDVHTFENDPDMLLVRVGRPDGLASLSTHAMDWDDFAPRSVREEVTVAAVKETVMGLVAQANRALSTATEGGVSSEPATETYPEHAKLRAVHDASQALGEFLDGMGQHGLVLARWEHQVECGAQSRSWSSNDGPEWWCSDGKIKRSATVYRRPSGPDAGTDCPTCHGTGLVDRSEPKLVPAQTSIQQVLADWFEVDLNVLEDEKRQMLASLRGA